MIQQTCAIILAALEPRILNGTAEVQELAEVAEMKTILHLIEKAG